jgi:hypothetical protein
VILAVSRKLRYLSSKKKKKRERENEQKLQKGETKTTYVDDLQLFLHVASS